MEFSEKCFVAYYDFSLLCHKLFHVLTVLTCVFQPERRSPAWPNTQQASNNTKGIRVFQDMLHTTNGFVRNDSDPNLFAEKLTYKVR